MTISSRDGLSTALKVGGNRTTYQPLDMSDASVFDMARHWYTLDEIAATFNVSNNTVLDKHGDAFRSGKDNAMRKPRMLLDKIFEDFSDPDINFARADCPTQHLLKAIELHGKKYEGLGQKTIVEHQNAGAYDKVESKPEIIERPADRPDYK